MDTGEWHGLAVRTREGQTVGMVVGEFADGPLAGRLRVQGAYAPVRHKAGPQDGTAVYAIPRRAVVCRERDSLLLNASISTARGRWLMHVRRTTGASGP